MAETVRQSVRQSLSLGAGVVVFLSDPASVAMLLPVLGSGAVGAVISVPIRSASS